MKKKPKWTIDTCIEFCKKFKTIREIISADSTAWYFAKKNNLFPIIFNDRLKITTAEIKEEFVKFSDEEWIPFNIEGIELEDIYYVNKKCWIKNIKTKRVTRPGEFGLDGSGYPSISLARKYPGKNGRKGKSFLVHVIMAKFFLKNPYENSKEKIDIHHIDGNKENINLSNLTFLPKFLHLSAEKIGKNITERNIYYNKYNEHGELVESKIKISTKTEKSKTLYINSAIRNGIKAYGYYWEKVNEDVENYILNYGFPKRENWIKNDFITSHEVYINTNGIIKINGKLSIGSKLPSGYRVLSLCNKDSNRLFSVARLIYETVYKVSIIPGFEIDHINGNNDDNRIENLRIVSHQDNMNNKNTRNKLSSSLSKSRKTTRREVYMINPDTYEIEGQFVSVTEASRVTKRPLTSIERCCRGEKEICGGKLWAYKGEENIRISKFIEKRKVNVYHGFWNKKENVLKRALDFRSLKEFKKEEPGAYSAALRNKYTNELIFSEPRKQKNSWTYEKCFEEAKKFKDYKEFSKQSSGACLKSRRKGWDSDYTWMDNIPPKVNKISKYSNITKEQCYLEFCKFNKSRIEFKKNKPGLWKKAYNNGWLDEWGKSKTKKVTLDELIPFANKYESRSDFYKYDKCNYKRAARGRFLNILYPKKED